ncbi:hypothetical protein N657DRAFT_651175 [Parathielavia appendiculata]|uniref:Uncharacterized protein n=1 Tax=Parathielavia appendiculata TaxID=2587402 RepID=A0AAN6YYN5_9PEZI|nr:hypothetical protein N657DRAFT_651175 [Parathielavia appendiculata]
MKFFNVALLFAGLALAAPNPAPGTTEGQVLEGRACSSSKSICVNRCCKEVGCNGYLNCGRSFCNILEQCVCKCQYN